MLVGHVVWRFLICLIDPACFFVVADAWGRFVCLVLGMSNDFLSRNFYEKYSLINMKSIRGFHTLDGFDVRISTLINISIT